MRRLCLVWLFFLFCGVAQGASSPVPAGMVMKQGEALLPTDVLDPFLGIPYRNDGAINEKGEYTLFADESRRFTTPGLNCSGFVLGAGRFLLQDNIALAAAKKDRFGDSRPGASLGEDWDFGWDLLLNLADGRNARLLLPEGGTADPFQYNGLDVPSFDLHGRGVWNGLLSRLKSGNLYLLSYSRPSSLPGYTLQHYHVGLMVHAGQHLWMYQTTSQSKKVYRRDMYNQQEKAAFLKAFANTGKARKKVAVVEIPLP